MICKGLVSGDPDGKLKKLSLVVFIVLSVVVFGNQKVPAIDFLAGGMATPETISPSNGAYGGQFNDYYFVPDPGRASGDPTGGNTGRGTTVWVVPKTGGPGTQATVFSTPTNTTTVGGLFLPSGWGDAYSNKFMTVGWKNYGTPNVNNFSSAYFNVYDANGIYSTPLTLQGQYGVANYLPKTPVLAPANWGSFGGNLLIADGAPAVYAIDSTWQKKNLITNNVYPELARFGLAFAPANWGTVGGKLLTSSDFRLYDQNNNLISITGRITAVDSAGNESIWAEIPIPVPNLSTLRGLRQMAFTPDNFIPGQHELLLVSVSGSQFGGGTLGDIWAFNSDGQLVAALRDTLNLTKFDPRGLYFEGDKLIISDATDPLWIATSADFQAVPIPPTVFLLGSGPLGLVGWRRFRKS